MSNNIPNAATLLEFAHLQVAAETLYDSQDIVSKKEIDSHDLTKGNKHSSKFTDVQASVGWATRCPRGLIHTTLFFQAA